LFQNFFGSFFAWADLRYSKKVVFFFLFLYQFVLKQENKFCLEQENKFYLEQENKFCLEQENKFCWRTSSVGEQVLLENKFCWRTSSIWGTGSVSEVVLKERTRSENPDKRVSKIRQKTELNPEPLYGGTETFPPDNSTKLFNLNCFQDVFIRRFNILAGNRKKMKILAGNRT